MVNLFSVEAITSGLLRGRPLEGAMNAAKFQISKKVLDWMGSKDKGISEMYRNAAKIQPNEIYKKVTPEILWNEIPISKRRALMKPKAPKVKRIANESSEGVITPENKIKRLDYNPEASTQQGPHLKGEYTGGFGQFILKKNNWR